jgi:hypothetical protein
MHALFDKLPSLLLNQIPKSDREVALDLPDVIMLQSRLRNAGNQCYKELFNRFDQATIFY